MVSTLRFDHQQLNRRALLVASIALPMIARASQQSMRFDPFGLGVASGSPTADGCVIWTRLIAPAAATPLPDAPIPVRWEVAADERFTQVLQSGETLAMPDEAHSLRVELRGLAPQASSARVFWYRFIAGDISSPIGRACSLPPPNSHAPMRFAVASCQHFEHGLFGAHRHLAQEALDLVLFMGDYIYEYGPAPGRVRQHSGGVCLTLSDYRSRYAQYKADADLQSAHAACPWIVTWDDHEVVNDYADDRSAVSRGEEFLARRAAAYQAYWEHMPLPRALKPVGPHMPIYRAYRWGQTAQLHMLDARQYRHHHVCTPADQGGSRTVTDAACPMRRSGTQSLLGEAQERWLMEAMASNPSSFNLIGQASIMSAMRLPRDRRDPNAPLDAYWNDSWDGYHAARERLLAEFARHKNVVSLGGDVHAHYVGNLKLDFDKPDEATVATEFVGTSITSPSWPQVATDRILSHNPHIALGRSDRRGYLLAHVTREQMRVDLRVLDDVRSSDAHISTLARFAVDPKHPGAQRFG